MRFSMKRQCPAGRPVDIGPPAMALICTGECALQTNPNPAQSGGIIFSRRPQRLLENAETLFFASMDKVCATGVDNTFTLAAYRRI